MATFHIDRAAYHRAEGRTNRARRHEAAAFGTGLDDMPTDILMRILEHTDYDMNLFAASQGLRDDTTAAMHVARKLILCEQPEKKSETLSISWFPRESIQLNVHLIIDLVVRGHRTTAEGLANRRTSLREAILSIAENRKDAAHDALLVRAPFLRRVETSSDAPFVLRSAARELLDALRPSIVEAIRSERIGTRLLYEHASQQEMSDLVDRIGSFPFRDGPHLCMALLAYVRDHIGHGASLKRLLTDTRHPTTGRIDADTRVVDVCGPLCFWDTSLVESGDSIFSSKVASQIARSDVASGAAERRATIRALRTFSADLFWATQNMTSLSETFSKCEFDGRIGHLNVSRVRNMSGAFFDNGKFNQPLGDWCVRSVKNMSNMFWGAMSFDQPLARWVVSNVTNLSGTFAYALLFNRPIGAWDVTRVLHMSGTFMCAVSFNQPLAWDVRSVETMTEMFSATPSFQQQLSWDFQRGVRSGNMFRDSAYPSSAGTHVSATRPRDVTLHEPRRGRRMRIDPRTLEPVCIPSSLPSGGVEAWYQHVQFDNREPTAVTTWWDTHTVGFVRV
jgi:hypothetical protein